MSWPLNPLQRLFIDHYLIDLNGKEAAIRAGYNAKDANSRAAKLLRRPDVKAAIRAAMDARAARTGITAERVIDEYGRIAFADIRDFVDWDSTGVRFVDAKRLSPGDTRLVAELVEGPVDKRSGAAKRLRRVKLFDKFAALRSLLRIFDGHATARFRLAAAPAPRPIKATPRPQFTARQRRFAAEYVKDFEGTAAAIRAGYVPGNTARTRATALLRHPHVVAAIEAAIEARRVPIGAEADRVLAEYALIAFADIGRVAAWSKRGVRIKRKAQIAEDDSAAIQTLGPVSASPSDGRSRLRLYDKVHALDALAQHLGLLDPRMPGRPAWLSGSERRTSAALRARLGYAGQGR